MARFIKWLMILLIIILIASANALLVLEMEWPLWMFLVNLLVLVVTLILLLYVTRWVKGWMSIRKARSSEKRNQKLDQFDQSIEEDLQQFQNYWKNSIKKVQKVFLSIKSTSLNEVPWYLIIGSSGEGKTQAINNSLVAESIAIDSPETNRIQDYQLNWSRVHGALLLDPPGCLIDQPSEKDQACWRRLLYLIKGQRNRSAINGIVVCISVDTLRQCSQPELQDKGVNLRKRLNELAQILGVRCPVYVLITKCDRIDGLLDFFDFFPKSISTQAVGRLFSIMPAKLKVKHAVNEAMSSIYNKLARLRLLILGSEQLDYVKAPSMFFPENIKLLTKSIQTYITPVFESGDHHETHLLRGLYFTSANQDGNLLPGSLARHGMRGDSHTVGKSHVSYFLRDIFSSILLRDRDLAQPTLMAIGISKLSKRLSLMAWLLICGSTIGLMSFTYTADVSILSDTDKELVFINKQKRHDLATYIDHTSHFRTVIESMEREKQERWLPRFGLHQVDRVTDQLKMVYVNRVRRNVLNRTDQYLDRSLDLINDVISPQLMATHVDFLSRRIQLLLAVQSKEHEANLAELPLPDFGLVLSSRFNGSAADYSDKLGSNYLSYLMWQPNKELIEYELLKEKKWLQKLYKREEIGLSWLIDWANMQEGILVIDAKDFWLREVKLKKGKSLRVPRAYTIAGWEAISRFLDDMQAINKDDPAFVKERRKFLFAYFKNYYKYWQRFLKDFSRGANSWRSEEQRLELARIMSTEHSPYDQVFNVSRESLEPIVLLENEFTGMPPAWVDLILSVKRLDDGKYQKMLTADPSVLKRLTSKGSRVLSKVGIKSSAIKPPAGSVVLKDRRALIHYLDYKATLKQAVDQLQVPAVAFDLSKNVYKESKYSVGEPKSAIAKSFWDIKKLQEVYGSRQAAENVFWDLLYDQTRFIWSVVLKKAQTHIQEQWENDVLAQSSGLEGWELVETLQGAGGNVWEFQKNTVAPFLQKKNYKGYRSRKLYGESINFSKQFLSLLNKGKIGKDALSGTYRVKVSALPTDTNPGALVKPHETRLMLQCSTGKQEIVNQNYPITKTFEWAAQDCGDVTIEIAVGNVILKKSYTGYKSLVNFFKEFRSGKRVFTKKDFPSEIAILDRYKIDRIELAYQFSGHRDILRLASSNASAIPKKIVLGSYF